MRSGRLCWAARGCSSVGSRGWRPLARVKTNAPVLNFWEVAIDAPWVKGVQQGKVSAGRRGSVTLSRRECTPLLAQWQESMFLYQQLRAVSLSATYATVGESPREFGLMLGTQGLDVWRETSEVLSTGFCY